MSSELPVFSIVAMATVTASLITAIISFVNLTLTKEQKISEFRQAWIDALREDLSIFLLVQEHLRELQKNSLYLQKNLKIKINLKFHRKKLVK